MKNCSEIFQRLMTKVLGGLEDMGVKYFIDDILMAANEDNPPPLPGESFEEYKKTINMIFDKPQEPPFPCVLPPHRVENIIHILEKCSFYSPTGSDDEIEEGEVESSNNDKTAVLDMDEIWELVELALKQRVISQQSTAAESLPSTSHQEAEAPPAAFSGGRSPDVGSPHRSSDISRKKSRESSRRHRSKSPVDDLYPKERRRQHRSRDSPDNSYSRKKDERHRRRKSQDSRSESPDDSYNRKKEKRHSRRRRSRDSPVESPDDSAYRKKDGKRPRRRKSRDSLGESPDDSYNRKKDEKRHRRRKSPDSRSISPDSVYYRTKDEKHRRRHRSGNSRSKSPDNTAYRRKDEETSQKRLTKDPSPKALNVNFPVDDEDDYGVLLCQEMKKRKLLPESDKEPEIRVKKEPEDQGRSLAASTIEESVIEGETKNFQDVKKEMKIEIPEEKKFVISSDYFCDLCQKALNSQVTWESHINGKKHAQKLKLQTVGEIAKGSLSIPKTPALVSEDIPRFANAPLGKKRVPRQNAVPRLQQTIDEYRDSPLPGLDTVQEIISPMDVDYYCGLCDAPCKSVSIMPHLIGFKHQLRAVRKISPEFYERNKDRQDKRFKADLRHVLMEHERRYGRGYIQVFNEVEDPGTRPAYDQPGPSWSNPYPAVKLEKRGGDPGVAEKDQWLDMSKGDFFCTLCDSHMNNVNMWEAHVRGKRHLGNAKKIPGANISKMKSERIPNAVSRLEEMIDEEFTDEMVVGLDYIRETRGLNGEIYNCFLCGSCSTNFDILDHILLLKHRTRYLEKLYTDGKINAIKDIDNLALKDNNYRIALINDGV
ncbi:hypothetical protein JTE90_020467 [Oedothorax gibbosus]|uniref:C2H2-type domain-containing protein n=1 Tax=Oedothorax gibbosus TaxID=931172 RepID=A0AAV6U9K1_9ARAC|nr:hypothetical protein JTE90_020467 [Oedothorax gibbosus]